MTSDSVILLQQSSAPIRTFYRISVVLILLKVGADLLAYPAVLTTAGSQAIIYLLLLGLALLLSGWVALGRSGLEPMHELVALRQGTSLGLLCGAVWVFELCIANLTLFDTAHDRLAQVLYFGTTAAGFLLPALAALLAARQTRQLHVGLMAGLRCGTLSGLLVFLAYSALATLLLQAGQHDAQTLREFQHSGLTDLPTFLVGDYLAAMIAHLWIGLITGLVGGAVGGVLGQIMSRSPEGTRTQP
jgi:hypothetical protein